MIKFNMDILSAFKNNIKSLFKRDFVEPDADFNSTTVIEAENKIPAIVFEPTVSTQISQPVSSTYKTRNPRQHQVEALSRISNETIGQISIPTGTGKTFIQLMTHISDMIEKTNKNEVGVYVISAHRLVLCKQLFNEFFYESKYVYNLQCDYLCVSSDQYTLKTVNKSMKNFGLKNKDIAEKSSYEDVEVNSTTNKSEIRKFVHNSKKLNRHCVIISTYDSFDRLSDLPSIDVCTYDEAHEITRDDYFSNVDKIKPLIKKQFFFTATRKESDCKRGMNQVSFYGDVI